MKPRFRETAAWCLFDFANSSFTTLIVTVAYAVYFREVVVDRSGNVGDELWGRAIFIAMLMVVLLSPVLGALADGSGKRKFLLVSMTLMTVAATASLFFVGPGDVLPGMVLFIIGMVGFEAGYVFYNAFLPEVSTPRTIGRVSGWGWAIGYAGGLLALVACLPFLKGPLKDAAGAVIPEAVRGRQFSFLLVAVFFLVFAVPAMIWLRESKPQERISRAFQYFTLGFRRVRDTLSHMRDYRQTAKFVFASLCFNDGITTVITFSGIYATVTFSFSGGELVYLFLIMNVVAFPGSLAAGYLADRIGAKKTIILCLVLWLGVIVFGAAAQGKAMFYAMASGAALGMGSIQAVGRSFMAQISPPEKESEFFGFYVLSGKFASMFGPLIFGIISARTESQRLAVLSLLPFFLAGLALMAWIDEARAIRDAGRSR
jgi:UMF1 family MFS transporter